MTKLALHLAHCPHDERLAAAHVAGGEDAFGHLVGNDFSATRVPVSYASEDLRETVAMEGNLEER